MNKSDTSRSEMDLSLFFYVLRIITQAETTMSRSETRVFGIILSGVAPPLFLERCSDISEREGRSKSGRDCQDYSSGQ